MALQGDQQWHATRNGAIIGRCEYAAAFFLRVQRSVLGRTARMPEPYCLAMVLCDAVHRDAITGKFTILGTFSTFAANEFPAKVQFSVYYAVTDGLGPTSLRLRLVDAKQGIVNGGTEDEGLIFDASAEFNFESPLLVLELAVGIGVPLPEPGLYHCELWAGDELLMSRRMLAVSKKGLEEGEREQDNE